MKVRPSELKMQNHIPVEIMHFMQSWKLKVVTHRKLLYTLPVMLHTHVYGGGGVGGGGICRIKNIKFVVCVGICILEFI